MEHVLGQARAIELLQAALAGGRLHHAYIFHGPAGVGKFTAACAFARILLCHDRQTNLTGQVSACESCASCRLLAPLFKADDAAADPLTNAHSDFHVVTKELARFSDDSTVRQRKLMSIPVDVLRSALLEPLYHAAQLGHGKVFIVDEAELLAEVGQNKLLKTLEEPPAETFLILVTSKQEALLPTIRSRCQRIAFVPMSDDIIGDWLDRHGPTLSAKQRDWLILFSEGSLGRAKLAIEFNLLEWGRAVLPALQGMARGQYPVNLGAQMAELIDAFAKRWVDEHANASKEAANKQAAGLMWALIAQHARQRIDELARRCDGGDPVGAEAALEPWLGVIDALQSAQRHLASNVNLGLVADHLTAAMFASLNHVSAGSA